MRIRELSLFLFVMIISTLIVFTIMKQSPMASYVTAVKSSITGENVKLIIEQKALEENEPSIDARTDPIWGNIPGYDGLVIDTETIYQITQKQKKKNFIPSIYMEEEAKVKLDDLKPNPIYRGNAAKPMISLMINVAWGTEHLQSMLDTLNKYNIQCTFFLDGSWANKNQELIKEMHNSGHEIGNHAYSHPSMSKLSVERMKEEIVKTEQVIEAAIGKKTILFAPPSGDFNEKVVSVAHNHGYKTILWTLDTVDWQKPTSDVIIQRIVPKASNGALVLMHPTESTAIALPKMIEQLQQKGFYLGTVSEMLSSKRLLPIEDIFSF
ncbi:MAG: polysaccharide deacetylase family protein [Bacilli bacterium]